MGAKECSEWKKAGSKLIHQMENRAGDAIKKENPIKNPWIQRVEGICLCSPPSLGPRGAASPRIFHPSASPRLEPDLSQDFGEWDIPAPTLRAPPRWLLHPEAGKKKKIKKGWKIWWRIRWQRSFQGGNYTAKQIPQGNKPQFELIPHGLIPQFEQIPQGNKPQSEQIPQSNNSSIWENPTMI